jgi:hypothetical protein
MVVTEKRGSPGLPTQDEPTMSGQAYPGSSWSDEVKLVSTWRRCRKINRAFMVPAPLQAGCRRWSREKAATPPESLRSHPRSRTALWALPTTGSAAKRARTARVALAMVGSLAVNGMDSR